ncbi:MAG: adenylate/guanylate cyclase domain-containing protein [Xanthobacteraceae bacterium]|jgi:class 3 adenylate cyclase
MTEERLQRRLAAILAADVVGYSRLMGLDEAGTLSRLNALRRGLIDPAIASHSGRIVKLMGDGALVEFASAVDAVTCAIEIQRQLRKRDAVGSEADPIRFRIGINVGDIIVQGDDILGDGVNIAARIEGVAEPWGHLAFGGRLAAGAGQGGCQLRR